MLGQPFASIVRHVFSWERFSKICAALITLAAVVGVVGGAIIYIDGKIESIAHSERFLSEVAANVRPSVVFDLTESIVSDQGAMMNHIDKIAVASTTVSNMMPSSIVSMDVKGDISRFGESTALLPTQIVVSPRVHLDLAPHLTALNGHEVIFSARRGKQFDWIYDVDVMTYVESKAFQFRLEVLISR